MELSNFLNKSFFDALKHFFDALNVPVNYIDENPTTPGNVLFNYNQGNKAYQLINDVYAFGMVDNAIFEGNESFGNLEEVKAIKEDYDGILIFGVTLHNNKNNLLPNRSQLAEIARAFNRSFPYTPVVVVFKYQNYIAFANTERTKYIQEWREGEKAGKVTLLKDIDCNMPVTAHLKILLGDRNADGLRIDPRKIDTFRKIYAYWQSVFSLQTLNNQFYADLQNWFYYAVQKIRLPYCPGYIDKKENIKNFLVRLLARTMFCWFVKEKGLIKQELLELKDWQGNKYPLTNDVVNDDFLESNSYYRGILQNIFFNALNQQQKKSVKDFNWIKYLHPDFDYSSFISIPYLNGGIFDRFDEDNYKESIEDSVLKIPNYLFYGITSEETTEKGRGANIRTETEQVEHKGLNEIFKEYKFTLEENTPFEEDIALDPELLGLVFENLLAELDPNLEESMKKSIRKLTGSYYTPRKVINEMVNESLYLYLSKYIETKDLEINGYQESLKKLVYYNVPITENQILCNALVEALDKYRVLDPACGSGAFPMGMLHRMVEILKQVDPKNDLWIELKLKTVDPAQRTDFKKILHQHLNDYGRKLGIIRDSIYGIDIQPLAVQITKLRFFISLLIDQKTEKGITPMPNIETKIICADSLRNIQPDLWSTDAIDKLYEARIKFYQPEISNAEREKISNEIVNELDRAFPQFSKMITGKVIPGQNKALLKEWFNHATLAAPFFNQDFFFPELKDSGFDCVIGNPPYGGNKITDDVRNDLNIESKDPYGAFIARFLPSGERPSPLKHEGVLAFIVSDTFMTIKSHRKLRRQMMDNYIHKMIRLHPDTFGATVNTSIIICERNLFPFKAGEGSNRLRSFNENHICQMVDLTNISIHNDYPQYMEVLHQTKGVRFQAGEQLQNISNEKYAIYYYTQNLINTNSNLPFFVASHKLFALMNDGNDQFRKPKAEKREIGGKEVQVRKIDLNGKEIEVVKLGDIAEVRQGLATGDNNAYLFQNLEVRGNYRNINDYKKYLLTDEDLETIRNDENLRLKVINNGINTNNPNSERYFGGRYIIPHDKGGESDSNSGFIPNYFIPTEYYLDWSECALKRMKNLTIGERDNNNRTELCAVIRNPETYFLKGITYSTAGFYAPSFRIGSQSVYGHRGTTIFTSGITPENLLGTLASKFNKFIIKSYINHTVASEAGTFDNIPFQINIAFKKLVTNIIRIQESNPRYDYASNEQIEIDKLVYEAYGLTAEDVEEVENWYARRYPKLSAAQKANLRKLGKTDDYLELYGMRKK